MSTSRSTMFIRQFAVALVAVATVTAFAAGSASAFAPASGPDRGAGSLTAAGLAGGGLSAKSPSASGAGAAVHVLSQSGGTAHNRLAAATTCTVSISPPVRAGAASVAVDYSVYCDQEVLGIYGIIGIFRDNESTPLGNTIDRFDLGRFGGGFQIQRTCASGSLYALMRVVVNFKTGSPATIDRTFAGPAGAITC